MLEAMEALDQSNKRVRKCNERYQNGPLVVDVDHDIDVYHFAAVVIDTNLNRNASNVFMITQNGH